MGKKLIANGMSEKRTKKAGNKDMKKLNAMALARIIVVGFRKTSAYKKRRTA